MADEFDDMLKEMAEEGLEEWATKLKEFSKDSMRQRVGQTAALEKENADLKNEVKGLKDGPVRRKALQDAGVDFDALRPAEREAIEANQAEKYDEDWAKSIVEKYELPINQQQGGDGQPPPNANQFGQPGGPTGNGGSTGISSRSTLTLAEVSSWPFDKVARFQDWDEKNGTDYYERLLRGEDVAGVTFS